MDDNHAPGLRCDGLLESMHIDVPAVVVKEWIADELYVIHVRQEIKERVTRRRNQEFVAGIAQ